MSFELCCFLLCHSVLPSTSLQTSTTAPPHHHALPAGDPSQAKLRPKDEPGEAHPGTSPGTGLKQNPTAAATEGQGMMGGMGSMGVGGQGSAEAAPGDVPPTSAEPATEGQQEGRAAEAARTVMWAAKEGAGEAVAKAEGAKAAASQAGQTVADRAAAAGQSAKASAVEAGQAAAGKAAAAGQPAKEDAQQAAAKVQGTAAGAAAGCA